MRARIPGQCRRPRSGKQGAPPCATSKAALEPKSGQKSRRTWRGTPMESVEKRKRERKKQELRKEKAAKKLQGLDVSGPSQADYFADLDPVSKVDPAEGEAPADAAEPKDANA